MEKISEAFCEGSVSTQGRRRGDGMEGDDIRMNERVCATLSERLLGVLDVHPLAERVVAALAPDFADAAAVYWDEQEPDGDLDRELDEPRIRRIASAGASPWSDPAIETHLVESAESAVHGGKATRIAVGGFVGLALAIDRAEPRRGALVVLTAAAGGAGAMDAWVALAEAAARQVTLAFDAAIRHAATQRKLRVRDEVITMLAHDLRNALGTASMNCQLLAGRSLDDPGSANARRQVEAIHRAVDWMSELVDDLLEQRVLEQERAHFDLEPLDAAALCEEAVRLVEPGARVREVRLHVEAAAGARVLGERMRILQVLSNLLSNALVASPPGSEVVVRVEPRAGARVCFSVKDLGPGIDLGERDAAALFRGTLKRSEPRGKSRGLGLPIARALVVSMGGKIWVESRAGQGSTFYFALPAAPSELD